MVTLFSKNIYNSFRGVPFYLKEEEYKESNEFKVYNYPSNAKKNVVTDLSYTSSSPDEQTIECYVIGQENREQLKNALSSSGSGKLKLFGRDERDAFVDNFVINSNFAVYPNKFFFSVKFLFNKPKPVDFVDFSQETGILDFLKDFGSDLGSYIKEVNDYLSSIPSLTQVEIFNKNLFGDFIANISLLGESVEFFSKMDYLLSFFQQDNVNNSSVVSSQKKDNSINQLKYSKLDFLKNPEKLGTSIQNIFVNLITKKDNQVSLNMLNSPNISVDGAKNTDIELKNISSLTNIFKKNAFLVFLQNSLNKKYIYVSEIDDEIKSIQFYFDELDFNNLDLDKFLKIKNNVIFILRQKQQNLYKLQKISIFQTNIIYLSYLNFNEVTTEKVELLTNINNFSSINIEGEILVVSDV